MGEAAIGAASWAARAKRMRVSLLALMQGVEQQEVGGVGCAETSFELKSRMKASCAAAGVISSGVGEGERDAYARSALALALAPA